VLYLNKLGPESGINWECTSEEKVLFCEFSCSALLNAELKLEATLCGMNLPPEDVVAGGVFDDLDWGCFVRGEKKDFLGVVCITIR